MNGMLINNHCKIQSVVALSAMEVEEIACAEVCREVLSLRYGLEELSLAQSSPTPASQDSTLLTHTTDSPR